MFIKNTEDLLDLARNSMETEVLQILLSTIEDVLAFAQPSNIMSDSITFLDKVLKIQDKSINLSSYDNFYLVALGKASQTMSSWMIRKFPLSFSRIIIVSPDEPIDEFASMSFCQCFKGGHPIPNEQSILAAEEVLTLLKSLTKRDLCFFLISGGGSALLESPDFGISLQEYVELQQSLLSCGAPIHEVNTIRKHFSKVKGGKLVSSSSTNILSFIISDVIGSDPSFIASGPTVSDKTSWEDCRTIFQKYNLKDILPQKFSNLINQGVIGQIEETPSDKTIFLDTHNFVIGDNTKLLDYTKKNLNSRYPVEILNYEISGEAKEIGKTLANTAMFKCRDEQTNPLGSSMSFMLFGGETTVSLSKSPGVGGRNQELALSFILATKAHDSIFLASFGTDGIDGNSQAAGAIVGPFTSLEEGEKFLSTNDANNFLKKFGGEIKTGYTGTNMMDFGIICIVSED